MKRIVFCILLLFTIISCEKPRDYYITFENNSNKTVIVDIGFGYPKDSINVIESMYIESLIQIRPNSSKNIFGGFEKPSSWYIDFYHSQTRCSGYVSFYIMDASVKRRHDLETIQKEYMLLARYDITQEDIERLDWTISYPPTPEMHGVHMWISY